MTKPIAHLHCFTLGLFLAAKVGAVVSRWEDVQEGELREIARRQLRRREQRANIRLLALRCPQVVSRQNSGHTGCVAIVNTGQTYLLYIYQA